MKILDLFIDVSMRSDRALRGLDDIQRKSTGAGGALGGVGAAALAASGPLIAAGAAVLTVTSSFSKVIDAGALVERGLVGVKKTTSLTAQELEELRVGIGDLATDQSVNSTVEQLYDLAGIAGTLGIKAKNDILNFTETISKLQGASGGTLGGEAAGQLLFAILRASDEGIDKIDELSSTFVELGNTFAVNEGQIASVADRVFKSLSRFDVPSHQVVGLAAAFADLSITPENAGTAITMVLGKMEKALGSGGSELKAFTKVTGQSTAELKELLKQDAPGAFLAVAEGLKVMGENGSNVTLLLEELGLNSTQIGATLPLVAQGVDRVAEVMRKAQDAYEENIALTEEAKEAGETWDAKTKALSNSWILFKAELANTGILDVAKDIVDATARMTKAATEWTRDNENVFTSFGIFLRDFNLNNPMVAFNNIIENNAGMHESWSNRSTAAIDAVMNKWKSFKDWLSNTGFGKFFGGAFETFKEDTSDFVNSVNEDLGGIFGNFNVPEISAAVAPVPFQAAELAFGQPSGDTRTVNVDEINIYPTTNADPREIGFEVREQIKRLEGSSSLGGS